MIRRLLQDLTKRSKTLIAFAIISFVLNSLLGAGMIVLTINTFSKINAEKLVDLHNFCLMLIGLLVLKGTIHLIGEVFQHQAGFETVAMARERLFLRFKQFYIGKHHELMQNEGLYKELWDAQERAKEWKLYSIKQIRSEC